MSVSVDLQHLLSYSDHERAKWKSWIAADSASRLAIPFQSGARFPTVGSLLNHMFWVEERHLARLEGQPVPETAGAPENDLSALFDYADRVRANLRRFVTACDDQRINEAITFARDSTSYTSARAV